MKKGILALLFAAMMLLSLTACNAGGPTAEPTTAPTTTEPTTDPTQPETAPIISQVQWLVNEPYGMKDLWDFRYDAVSNTLEISGEIYGTREIVFFEGCNQIQKETCLDDQGMICSQKEYDEQGNLIYQLDEYDCRTVYVYDEGVLVQEKVYYEAPEPVTVKTWSYDDAGRESAYTEHEADQLTVQELWEYDDAGFISEHLQESFYGDEDWFYYETFVYEDGLLKESTHEGDDPADAWNYSVVYSYDDQGRMISALRKDDFCGEAEDIWEYDSQGRVIKSVEHYNMDGWVAETNEYEYDDDRLIWECIQEGYPNEGEVFFRDETQYTYDSNGQLTQSKCDYMNDSQYIVNYSYDGQGKRTLQSIVVDGVEQYLVICDYDSQGNCIRVDRNGETDLTGDNILFLTNENGVEFYMTVQYEEATDAAEAAAVNDFILQYIQENY